MNSQAFTVERVSSLTVHLEHAGEYTVGWWAPIGYTCDSVPVPGYFKDFGVASDLAHRLNRVWNEVPEAGASQVLAFVLGPRDPNAALIAAALEGLAFAEAVAGLIAWAGDHGADKAAVAAIETMRLAFIAKVEDRA